MKWNKKIFLAVFWFIGIWILAPNVLLEASSHLPRETHIIDHEENAKNAKKWANAHFKDWKKKLTESDVQSLEELLKPLRNREEANFDNVNYQLKIYGGDLSSRPIDTLVQNKKLQDHVDRISEAINRKEGKLEKPLIVYKNESVQDVLHIKDKYFQNEDLTLNANKVKELRNNFVYGLHSEFGVYDLFENPYKKALVKWKIKLPSGTPTGLINQKIIIDKDSAFKVNEIKIISQNGKQLIRIDADLIPKEIAENQNKQIFKKIEQDFATFLNLPDKKIFEFKFSGSGSHFIAKKLNLLMETFITHINPSIIRKTLQFMSESGGHLILTDHEIYTLSSVYHTERTLKNVLDMMDTAGYYNINTNRTLSLNVPYSLQNGNEIDKTILFHEFGHAIDNFSAQIIGANELELSLTAGFKEIFKEEGENLTPYANTNEMEFFAEAFRLIHSPETSYNVKERAPKTYELLLAVMDMILEHEITKSLP